MNVFHYMNLIKKSTVADENNVYCQHVVNYLFLLQLKALFHNLIYLHRRALSSQPTPFQVLKIKTIKTTNSENKDESTPLSLSCKQSIEIR